METLLTLQQQEVLFTEMESKLDSAGCDMSHRHTRKILEEDLGLSESLVQHVIWEMESHGGYCDCEVILNYADCIANAITIEFWDYQPNTRN